MGWYQISRLHRLFHFFFPSSFGSFPLSSASFFPSFFPSFFQFFFISFLLIFLHSFFRFYVPFFIYFLLSILLVSSSCCFFFFSVCPCSCVVGSSCLPWQETPLCPRSCSSAAPTWESRPWSTCSSTVRPLPRPPRCPASPRSVTPPAVLPVPSPHPL